ncbi:MFS transporter [Cellulomonas hominis]|uniref:MFS family permease n=1 Tax=Cellulomonas hominis TaxID=156981 RepID=A0A511F9H3_9CELL|nr:MFS transporter [Cellulomonas hominis]MBB5472944.1 MFS family permease [Cellulomonas hominis]NKY06985.1 MFS transporter [Cellulomonas hominis]GEL45919.1 MFS transporter [Cellulomonas hominis]
MQVVSDLKQLWPLVDFRRLLTVRLVSQCSDGLFQAGLATLFFFSPENATTATGVAAAFAVLLLPFTVVGPWAGVLLDRWRRRQVLLVGNLVRTALTVLIAVIMATAGVGPVVYVLALVTLSVNRFLLSALSASLPRVVAGPLLLTANSITPTLGTVSAGIGAGIGLLLGLVLPDGGPKDVAALLSAAALMSVASLAATRIDRDRLGPDTRADAGEMRRALSVLARGLVDGARYLVRRGTPGRALGVMAVHRFLYGVVFISSILISRNLLSDPADARAGLLTFGVVAGVTGAGFALAIVVTPVVSPLIGPHGWITVCLLMASATQALLAVTVARPAVLAGSLVLGLAAQGAKIAVDTIVQRDTADEFRGRAFALYDVLYNAAFVGAAALAAVALPDTGWSPAVFALLAAAYLATALVYRTRATEPTEVPARA